MVKQMSQTRPTHTQPANHQPNIRQIHNNALQFTASEQNHRQETFSFLNQFNDFHHELAMKSVSANAERLQLPKSEMSCRLTFYPIEDKKYRLISLTHEDDDSDSINELEHPEFDDDFREPMLFLPRFNPFARWNARNQTHQRRRHLLNNSRRANSMRNKKSYIQSVLNYARKVYTYIKSARLSTWYEYVPFYPHPPTLESKYRHISLAILNNSINLEVAVIKALEYNIPLVQIVMNPRNMREEQTVVEKILKDFAIAHFINQNFVLYGDWSHFEKYREVFTRNSIQEKNIQSLNQENFHQQAKNLENGKIIFRKGEIVFAEIEINYVERIDHNEFQEKLEEIRNHYYQQKQLYINSRSISPQTNINLQKDEASLSSETNSKGSSTKPKTVKEIQEQILKDYLEQKMQQEMIQRENIYQDEYSDSQMELEEQYSGQSNTFQSNQTRPNRPNDQTHDREQNDNEPVESRKVQQSSQKHENQKQK